MLTPFPALLRDTILDVYSPAESSGRGNGGHEEPSGVSLSSITLWNGDLSDVKVELTSRTPRNRRESELDINHRRMEMDVLVSLTKRTQHQS